MTLLDKLLGRTPSTYARQLALEGVKQRRDKVRAVAKQIRRECGMPDDPRLA